MYAISAKNISLSYGTAAVLSDITFPVRLGEKIGLVGTNGAGKSSLLKILVGQIRPDGGEVSLLKGKTVGYLSQHAQAEDGGGSVYEEALSCFDRLLCQERELALIETQLARGADPEESVRLARRHAERYEEFTRGGGLEYRGRTKAILAQFGFDEAVRERPVASLSGGQKTVLSLVRLILSQPDILLLDEPTNHLDIGAVRWLEGYLKGLRGTVIAVSHDRYFLDSVTDRTFEIENTRGTMYPGGYSAFAEEKRKRREAQQHRYDVQQKEIARLEAFIEQQRRWNRERNIIAAESRQKAIDRMEKIERPEELPAGIDFSFLNAPPSGNDVLSVQGLSLSFGEKQVFREVNFEVKRGDRLLIVGKNGSGKSSLLKVLIGKYRARGEFSFGSNTKIGYYDQEYQGLHPEKTVLDELWDEHPDRTATQLRNTLALFQFRGEDVFKRVAALSGGEKARLTLSKLMLEKTNVLLLDEPTNHLDIASRETLEQALSAFGGTVIAVSHDRYFIRRLATGILELQAGGTGRLYPFSYETYLEKRAEEEESAGREDAGEKKDAPRSVYEQKKQERAMQRRRERGIEKAEADIARLEAELAALELRAQALAADYQALTALEEERQEAQKRLDALYGELQELLDA